MMLLFVQTYWKYLLVLAGVLGSFGAGFLTAHRVETPQVIEKTVEVEKVVEKIVEKVVVQIVEVEKKTVAKKTVEVKKPDGTVITETNEVTQTDTSKKTDSTKDQTKEKIEEKRIEKETIPTKKTYKAGVLAYLDRDYAFTAGWNFAGPFWADSQYKIKQREASVGISIQF